MASSDSSSLTVSEVRALILKILGTRPKHRIHSASALEVAVKRDANRTLDHTVFQQALADLVADSRVIAVRHGAVFLAATASIKQVLTVSEVCDELVEILKGKPRYSASILVLDADIRENTGKVLQAKVYEQAQEELVKSGRVEKKGNTLTLLPKAR